MAMEPPASESSLPDVAFAPSLPQIVMPKPIEPTVRSGRKLTAEQREAMAARSRERNETISEALGDFYALAQGTAKDLSEKCGNKPHHYMRKLFTGGMSQQKSRKPNPYNAWQHQLAKEHNASKSRVMSQDPDSHLMLPDAGPGNAASLLELVNEHRDEYDKLTRQEKRELVSALEEERSSRNQGVRLNQRGRVKDCMNTLRKIEQMVSSSAARRYVPQCLPLPS